MHFAAWRATFRRRERGKAGEDDGSEEEKVVEVLTLSKGTRNFIGVEGLI